jgi:cation diffusion facilitator CzcD-associated flavoprotein CzcO
MAFDAIPEAPDLEVLIVGTGFAGLGMAIQLKRAGVESFTILERAHDVGGTWRDNRYPGCACDIPSHLYSFSFELNSAWTRHYPPQREIWDYLRHCAKKYGLLPHIRFGAELVQARYDEAAARWRVTTRDGRVFSARVLVSGMGGLSNPTVPTLPGLEHFAGTSFHSAQWNADYDLRGKRVAVIGSGASAIQLVPQIQPLVAQLDYYQRTPAWILPHPDRAVTPFERWLFRWLPFTQRLLRAAIYCVHESRVSGFTQRSGLLPLAARLARRHIRSQIVEPELRRKLTPDYALGCKRILISNDYYPALERPNVEVITDAIREVKPHGIVTADGRERQVDAIIFATGFRAQQPFEPAAVLGRGGVDIVDTWQAGPEAYLGTTVSGFPNFFMLVGPNTGLGHNSMVYMIESQIRYVMSALRQMSTAGLSAVDVRPEVQRAFNEQLQTRHAGTVWASGCRSWYLNENGRNTTLWPGPSFIFRHKTRRFRLRDYLAQAKAVPGERRQSERAAR